MTSAKSSSGAAGGKEFFGDRGIGTSLNAAYRFFTMSGTRWTLHYLTFDACQNPLAL